MTIGRNTKHFPIFKRRVGDTKEIESVEIIKLPQNTRDLRGASMKDRVKKGKQDDDDDHLAINREPIIEEFYATYDEFADDKDSYF